MFNKSEAMCFKKINTKLNYSLKECTSLIESLPFPKYFFLNVPSIGVNVLQLKMNKK